MQEFIIQTLTNADVNHKSELKRRTEIKLLSSTLLIKQNPSLSWKEAFFNKMQKAAAIVGHASNSLN